MKAYLETYGCQMNINESDVLGRRLTQEGYDLVSAPEDADVILLNTCSIREHAESKVLSRLGRLRHLKEEGKCSILGVTGCMAQRLGGEFLTRVPYLDLVIGSGAYPRFFSVLDNLKRTGRPQVDVGYARDFQIEDQPKIEPGAIKTFITIIRGCDNSCHYCIVPFTRGHERSKPLGQILREAEWCVDRGVREITLLGQNVNHYQDGEFGLAECLRKVAQVPGIERVRFTTSHPGYMTDDVLLAMAAEAKVMPHLHLPMQSGNDRVLASMNREYTQARYREIIKTARQLMPEIALSTDVIVGFPGETAEEFEDTYQVMKDVEFDSAFMFKYSPRRGTVAAGLPDDVDPKEKQGRLARLIEMQRRISDTRSARFVGREVEVLVDGISNRDPERVVGKTREFKSAIFPGDPSWIGTIRNVHVQESKGVTLTGKPVDSDRPAVPV